MNPLPGPDFTRAVVYRRVSSAEQADRGYGLDSQTTDCEAFARAEGLEIVADYAEDARSTVELDQRASGADALEALLRLGAGVLLVARRDRLARDPYIAGHAKRLVAAGGGRILFADGSNGDDDSSLLLSDFKDVIAAHERRAIVARLRDGRDAKRRIKGERTYVGGRPAFGYRADPQTRELTIDPEAAAIVCDIFDRAKRGHSLAKIAADLSAVEAGGKRWHPTAVRRILTYAPYKQHRPEPIVSGHLFKAAQQATSKRLKRRAAARSR